MIEEFFYQTYLNKGCLNRHSMIMVLRVNFQRKNVFAQKTRLRILILSNHSSLHNYNHRNAKTLIMAHKFKWTEEQDSLLKSLREEKQLHSWISIANQINLLDNTKIRTPKQCRQRYINHVGLAPLEGQIVGEWSSLEQENFLALYQAHGPKWALIARSMPGRSEIFLKNRFYSSFRKMIRKINSVEQINKTSRKRFLKYQNLLRIIEADKQFKDGSATAIQSEAFLTKLKEEILVSVWNQEKITTEEIQEIILRIHKFNTMFSYFGMRKVKFHCHSKSDDLIVESASEKTSLEDMDEKKNQSQEPEITDVKSIKESNCEISQNWEGKFDDLLDIFSGARQPEQKNSNSQDLEEQLSYILKKDYVKPEYIYF